MKNKKDYNKIFEEYKELEMKTFIPVNDVNKGEIRGVHIKPKDMIRIDEVREELRKNLNLLSDKQLKFLYNDNSLMIEAVEVLANRNLEKNKIVKEKKQFDYESVKVNYEDSLSQYDFDSVFNNPDHGALDFKEVKKDFLTFFTLVFGLEVFNYRENLYSQEFLQVDSVRKELQIYFDQIRYFKIDQPEAPLVRQNLITQLKEFIVRDSKILEDWIIKIKTKNFFNSSEGKEAFADVQKQKNLIEEETKKIQEITREFKKLKSSFEEEVKNTQSLKVAGTERGIGESQVANFFSDQADEHHKNAVHETDGWLIKREKFEKYIYWLLGIGGFAFLVSFIAALGIGYCVDEYKFSETIDVWRSFWDFRSGLFITALLAIFYAGLHFSTKNYKKEKDLEYQNRNKSIIAKSVGLFSSGSSDTIRTKIYETASKTIFAPYKRENDNSSQNTDISLSTSVPNPVSKLGNINEN
jgi:hypothetical protein